MSFLSRMSLTLAGTTVFAAIALTGAAPAQAEKVLRAKMHSDLTVLDPIATTAYQGFSGGCQDSASFGWPCDETIEKLRSDFASESDPEKKNELAARVQERAYEIVTHLPLGQYFSPIAYSDKLKGVWPSVAPVFWGLDFES